MENVNFTTNTVQEKLYPMQSSALTYNIYRIKRAAAVARMHMLLQPLFILQNKIPDLLADFPDSVRNSQKVTDLRGGGAFPQQCNTKYF